MVRALLFDMDGVLVDSQLHWRTVGHTFLQRLIPEWGDAEQTSILGMSLFDLHRYLQDRFALQLSAREFINSYQGLADEIYGTRCKLFSGVRELMQRVRAEQWSVGVASASPEAWLGVVLRRFELESLVTVSVSSEHVHGRTKPAPDVYLEAVRLLNLSARNCLAIEDTEKGIRSANAAGVRCVGFRNGYNQQENFSNAVLECHAFDELSAELLTELTG